MTLPISMWHGRGMHCIECRPVLSFCNETSCLESRHQNMSRLWTQFFCVSAALAPCSSASAVQTLCNYLLVSAVKSSAAMISAAYWCPKLPVSGICALLAATNCSYFVIGIWCLAVRPSLSLVKWPGLATIQSSWSDFDSFWHNYITSFLSLLAYTAR